MTNGTLFKCSELKFQNMFNWKTMSSAIQNMSSMLLRLNKKDRLQQMRQWIVSYTSIYLLVFINNNVLMLSKTVTNSKILTQMFKNKISLPTNNL